MMQQLREELEVTLRDKLRRGERKNAPQTRAPQTAFGGGTSSSLPARELRTAQSRLTQAKDPHEPSHERSAGRSKPDDDRVVPAFRLRNQTGPRPSAAVIGSIDTDAVFRGYEKVKVFNKEYNTALLARKNELTKIMSEAQEKRRCFLN